MQRLNGRIHEAVHGTARKPTDRRGIVHHMKRIVIFRVHGHTETDPFPFVRISENKVHVFREHQNATGVPDNIKPIKIGFPLCDFHSLDRLLLHGLNRQKRRIYRIVRSRDKRYVSDGVGKAGRLAVVESEI